MDSGSGMWSLVTGLVLVHVPVSHAHDPRAVTHSQAEEGKAALPLPLHTSSQSQRLGLCTPGGRREAGASGAPYPPRCAEKPATATLRNKKATMAQATQAAPARGLT